MEPTKNEDEKKLGESSNINHYYLSKSGTTRKMKKPKRSLQEGEEFVDYKYINLPDGTTKRKKILKKTIKKVKKLTEE